MTKYAAKDATYWSVIASLPPLAFSRFSTLEKNL